MKITAFEKIKQRQINPQAYTEFGADIARYNLATLRNIGWVGMIIGLVLTTASLPFVGLLQLFYGYLSITVLFGIIVILAGTVMKKHDGMVLPVYYLFITLILCIGIAMGTYFGKDTNATTFVMLMITLPLFIIDRPYRLHLLFGAAGLVFCVVDFLAKTGELRDIDISNCIVFYLLSVVISRQTINAKMSDIIIKHELKQQRDMDMLTKLSNRGAFERVVAQYIHESNKNAVMLIMDIDNFKSVNDTMGHSYGDMVLQLVGEYLKEAFRSGDVVSRLGGDEFVAFLPNVTELSIITDRVDKLIKRIESVKIEAEKPCRISASVGIAQYPENGCSFEALYKQADAALYAAKRSGKGRYAVYDGQTMKKA